MSESKQEQGILGRLERWLPFKFRRKSKEEKQAEVVRTEQDPSRHGGLVPFSNWGAPHPLAQWMRGAFDDPFFREPFSRAGDLDRWFGDFSPGHFQPTIDVVDETDAICVTAELPGLERDDIELQLEGGFLVVRGEKRHQEEKNEKGVYRSERYYGYFHRAVPLPSDLDASKVEAKFSQGVLTVRLPKLPHAESETKRITVQG